MTPVMLISLLDPVLWALIWLMVWFAYRLPKWSWIRLLLAVLWLGSMAGIIGLQAHLLTVLEPVGYDPKIIDKVLFPEIIPALVVMVYATIREDRKKKRREAAGLQSAVDASAGVSSGKK